MKSNPEAGVKASRRSVPIVLTDQGRGYHEITIAKLAGTKILNSVICTMFRNKKRHGIKSRSMGSEMLGSVERFCSFIPRLLEVFPHNGPVALRIRPHMANMGRPQELLSTY